MIFINETDATAGISDLRMHIMTKATEDYKELIGKKICNVILFGVNFIHDASFPVMADEKVFLLCDDGSCFKVFFTSISKCHIKELDGKSYQTGKVRKDVTELFSRIIGQTIMNVGPETEKLQCAGFYFDEETSEEKAITVEYEFNSMVLTFENRLKLCITRDGSGEYFDFYIEDRTEGGRLL